MATFRRLGQSELLPRYIFAESLFARRRVLEIGAVASTLGQSARFLSTRGARVVVAADADLEAVQDAQSRLAGPNLRFRAAVFDDFEAGSFDLVIVADLAAYVKAPELLQELARLVAKSGYLMGGLRNPAGLALSNISDPEDGEATPTYGQLLDALTTHFNSIEVATQSPVLGYQLAFERGEGLQVDGSLAGHSEAAYFVVLAGQEPVRNFDPTWVQLPPEPLAMTGGKLEDASRRAGDWRDRSERLKELLAKKTVELQTRDVEYRETAQQLEAAKEAVSRLTAQLELSREAPDALRERDELAARIRRLEAEVTVARERSIDAEGRLTALRLEAEAHQRAQKDAAAQALAAVEQVRLERARKEEVSAQLEDSRSRLGKAYEELRRVGDEGAKERIEHERLRTQVERLKESIAAKENELGGAKERETRLAEARSQSLQAIEGLERTLAELRAQVAEAREEASRHQADKQSALRSLELDRVHREGLKVELERASARAATLEEELARRAAEIAELQTEKQAAESAHARALRDIETLSQSERTWREIAQQTEVRLTDTTTNVQNLSDQLAQAEAQVSEALARARRQELDLGTAITAERSGREQAEAALAQTQGALQSLTAERDGLVEQRAVLQQQLSDGARTHAAELQLRAALEQTKSALERRVAELDADVVAARQLVEEGGARERALTAARAADAQALENAKEEAQLLRASLAAVEASLGEARTRGDSLDASLARARAELLSSEAASSALIEEQAQQHRAAVAALEQASAAAVARADELEAKRAALVQELSAEREQRQGEKAEVEALISELRGQLATERDVVGRQKSALDDARAEATRAAAEVRAAMDLQQAELRGVQIERDRAIERAEGVALELTASAEQVAALQRLASQQAKQLKAMDGRIAELSASGDAQVQAVHAATQALHAATTRAEAIEAERERLAAAVVERTSAQQALAAELEAERATRNRATEAHAAAEAALRGQLETVTAQLSDLQAQLDAARAEKALLETTHAQALAQVRADSGRTDAEHSNELERVRAEHAQRVAEFTQTLEQARSAEAHVRAEFEELVHVRDAERAATATLQADLDAAFAQRDVAVSERAAAIAERDALQRQQETAASQQERSAAERTALQLQLERALSERQELETQRQTLAAERDAAIAQRQAAEAQRLESAAQRDAAIAERDASLAQKDVLLAEREAQVAASQQLAADQSQRAAEARQALEQAQQRAAELEKERDLAVAAVPAARGDLEVAQAEYEAALTKVRGEHAAAVTALQLEHTARITELQTQIEAARVSAAKTAETPAHTGADELKQSLDALTAQAATREAEFERQRAELEATAYRATERNQLLEGETAQQRKRLAVLEIELARMRERLPVLEAAVTRAAEFDKERQAFQQQLVAQKVELSSARAQLLAAQQASGESAATQALQERVTQLEADIEIVQTYARSEIEAAMGAKQQAEDLLIALREKYGQLQGQVGAMQQELASARRGGIAADQLAELQAENGLLEQERERLAQRVEALERQYLPAPQPSPSRLTMSAAAPPLPAPDVFELDVPEGADSESAEEILLEEPVPDEPEPGKP